MVPGATALFMWGFQSLFRRSLELDLKSSLELIGAPDVEPTVFLIGVLKAGASGWRSCSLRACRSRSTIQRC
jgi:hypothetical protein